ncbi:hypothetical protein [Arenimonas fontis]|nr:hypothetical protein [Arenimonas fontis]
MLHIVKLIERRRAGKPLAAALPWLIGSALALLTGLALLFLP